MVTNDDKGGYDSANTPVAAAQQRALRFKGILITTAATASVSLNFVTAKYTMQALEPLTFIPLWFAAAWVYCTIYGLSHRRQWSRQLRRAWKPLLAIGLLCAAASTLVFTGLHQLDPTVTSFLARSDALFMILLGFIVLGERFTTLSGGGMVLALAGMGIISYAGGSAQLGVVVMVVAGFLLYSLGRLVIKQIAASTSPVLINWMRVSVTAPLVGIIALSTGHFHIVPSAPHLIVLVLGAFFGPFLAAVLYFHGLRYIGLSELAVVRATQPVFVALYASLFLGMVPTPQQFAGGILIIIGAILMARARSVEQPPARPESELVTN